MMKFRRTQTHANIVQTIRSALSPHDLKVVRSDDKEYHPDLFLNVQTYIHGCGFGIAIFDAIEEREFSPNVTLEVGYMMALRRPVCLLKDRNLGAMQADLLGRLYLEFDPKDPEHTIPDKLITWLRDNAIAGDAPMATAAMPLAPWPPAKASLLGGIMEYTTHGPRVVISPDAIDSTEALALSLYAIDPEPIEPNKIFRMMNSGWRRVPSTTIRYRAEKLLKHKLVLFREGKYLMTLAGRAFVEKYLIPKLKEPTSSPYSFLGSPKDDKKLDYFRRRYGG
jgi:hypothetical protein